MKKRFLATLLSVCVCAGLLAGCGSKTTDESSKATSSPTSVGTKEAEVSSEEKEDPTYLKMVMYSEAGSRNTEFFKNEFHDKILDELNIDVDVEILPWGSVPQVETMLSSGEEIACMFHGSQTNWMMSGLVAPLDEELFNELCPDLIEARNGLDLASASYQGQLYCIPSGSQAFSGNSDNFVIRNDILNQVGWDYTDIKTYDNLMAAIADVHKAFPTLVIADNTVRAYNGSFGDGFIFTKGGAFDEIVRTNEAEPDSDKVYSYYESEFFAEYCRHMEEWTKLGYLTDAHLEKGYATSQWNAGNALMRYGGTINMIDHSMAGFPDADVQYLVIDDNPSIMHYNFDWGWALSPEAEHLQDELMRLLNWFYEDYDNFLFAIYGVEGTDWEYGKDGEIVSLTSDPFFSIYMHNTVKFMDETKYDEEDWKRYTEWDSKSITSKTLGFVFDNTEVATEEVALKAIVSEYIPRYTYGFESYDESFDEVLKMMKDAGLDKYVAEYQKQFTEFMANK